jgi:hypothetical protein
LCEIKIVDLLSEAEEKIIEKCNPNTIIFDKGEFEVFFKIFEKNNSENFIEKSLKIINKNKTLPIIPIIQNSEKEEKKQENIIEKEKILDKKEDKKEQKKQEIEKIKILDPKIIIQSGLSQNNICKSNPCNINLLYEAKNKREKCIWDF